MDTEQQKSSETLLYNFDYPMVTECGAVKITADRVILQFPEKPTVYVENSVTLRRNVTLRIENFPGFSIDRIPIHTGTDFFRVKEMIEKCLQSYSYLISKHIFHLTPIGLIR